MRAPTMHPHLLGLKWGTKTCPYSVTHIIWETEMNKIITERLVKRQREANKQTPKAVCVLPRNLKVGGLRLS